MKVEKGIILICKKPHFAHQLKTNYMKKGDKLMVVNVGRFTTLKNLNTKQVFWLPTSMVSYYCEKGE